MFIHSHTLSFVLIADTVPSYHFILSVFWGLSS
jgi:hypothetical protein